MNFISISIENNFIHGSNIVQLLENEYKTINDVSDTYIIAIGVGTDPNIWCEAINKDLLNYLSKTQLCDLQNKKAWLLIDQTLEGYSVDWLWKWFHNTCDKYAINVKQIIYCTGDLNAEKDYIFFCDNNLNFSNRINVISYPYFESVIFQNTKNFFLDKEFWCYGGFYRPKLGKFLCYRFGLNNPLKSNNHWFVKKNNFFMTNIRDFIKFLKTFDIESFYMPEFYRFIPNIKLNQNLVDFETQQSYKFKHLPNIKMFNILQKRPRNHRIWFFKFLYDYNLLQNNIVSMNKFERDSEFLSFKYSNLNEEDFINLEKILPINPPYHPISLSNQSFNSVNGAGYIMDLNEKIRLETFCSVISEVFYDSNSFTFISEKTFKAIATSHPFIIVGTKNFLKELHKIGYKTFHPYIDESYDNLEDDDRMLAIVKEMNRLQKMSQAERMDWFNQLKPILKHNFNQLSLNYHSQISKLHTTLYSITKNI